MNRKRRKAHKMFMRKYGRATFSFWRARETSNDAKKVGLTFEDLSGAFREAFAACVKGGDSAN